MPLIDVQRRLIEIGRIRLGEKGNGGAPKKLSTFRLTSASKAVLEAAAKLYGGTVRPWTGAPNEGTFEVTTTAAEIPVVIPPIPNLLSQYYELWSGGGCKRRCDGETELLSGGPCLCDKDARQAKEKGTCSVTTRVSVMLPQLPGLGLWRLESHGWNAATTLPGTVELLAGQGKFIQAVLRLEQRTDKKDGQTRRFVVPVIDIPNVTLGALLESGSLMIGGPAPAVGRVERPALPPAPDLPDENPEWNGGEKRSEQFLKIVGALENVPGPEVVAWKKKMDTAIGKLPENERAMVFEKINERVGLPF